MVGYHCGHRGKPTSQGLCSDEAINLKPMSTSSTERAIRALYFESHHSTHLSSYWQKKPIDKGEKCIDLSIEELLDKKKS